jgi:hypothetical protein
MIDAETKIDVNFFDKLLYQAVRSRGNEDSETLTKWVTFEEALKAVSGSLKAGCFVWFKRKTRRCRVCGCTDDNCIQCIEKTGKPCHWIEADLCSACEKKPRRKKG